MIFLSFADVKQTNYQDAVSKEKQYDVELIGLGFEKEEIHHYGFAFKGKEVLIGE